MHDVIRDVAILIARRDQHVFTKRNDDLVEWPDRNYREKCTKISLIDSKIVEPPEGLEFPELEFFYMSTKDRSFQIDENFFMRMANLKVLNLIGMSLFPLPSSLSLLVNLQSLCLEYSPQLEDVSAIGELKGLKVLSFRYSSIRQLPNEIGQLTQLKLLDLSYCMYLKVIAPNVISSLSLLEELYMERCSIQWEVEGLDGERSNASPGELVHLSNLSTLEIDILKDEILPIGFFSKKLERYKISIGGRDFAFTCPYESSRTLELTLNPSFCLDATQGIKNVEVLYLGELPRVKNVVYELDTEGFKHLKYLYVQDNSQLLHIVDSMDLVSPNAFPLLESLNLRNLNNLKKICSGQLATPSLCNLKSMKLYFCGQLKNIFSLWTARCLQQLQEIYVRSCQNMEEIFAIEGEDDLDDKIEFSHLCSLTLFDLPRLKSFCPRTSENTPKKLTVSTEAAANEITMKNGLDIPMSFFNEKVIFPKLEVLELQYLNVEKIWQSQPPTVSSSYQNFTRLKLLACRRLEYVFPSSVVKCLEQLQQLEIRRCTVLKEIVAEDLDTELAKFVFPRLTSLTLTGLRELETFYPKIHISEWPMLKELEVIHCDKVKIFNSKNDEEGYRDLSKPRSFFLIEKINPNLEKLKLGGKTIIMTWQNQFSENHFCIPIKILEFWSDESTNIPLGVLLRFKNLEKLSIVQSSYKEIFSCGENKHAEITIQIKVLELRYLSNVKCMWNQDSKLHLVLQNLEILEVHECGKLMNVVASSASLQNLTTLIVIRCDGLINLITSSTAKSLERLREITIRSCNLMAEVVANDPEDIANNEIVFNKLEVLSLRDLESLTSFCSKNYTFKFPSLEKLIVAGCPNMKTFSEGVLSAPKLRNVIQSSWPEDEWCWEGDLNTTIQHLYKTKVNSNSEKLTWQGQFPKYYPSGLKVLEVIKDESPHIPLRILHRFNDLEKLILKACSYKEICSSEEGEKHDGMPTQIKALELRGLFNLQYMCQQDSQLDSILQNLETLEVYYCHNLINLTQSLASFENLRTLEVRCCDGLRNLITSSTAESLAQLEILEIRDCEMMIEIVENKKDEPRDEEIVFRKLRKMSLNNLESLTSFCSGNYTFSFPALEELIVEKCPKMKIFSGGVSSTPKLEKVRKGRGADVKYLEGELNTTIQQL